MLIVTQILYLIYFVGYRCCYFRCRRCCCPSWPTTTSTIPCSSSSSIQASSIRKSSRKAPTPTFCLWIWCKGRLLWRWLRQERKPRCQRKRCWILRCPSPWWPCPNCNLHRWSLQRLRSWCQIRRYFYQMVFTNGKVDCFLLSISSLSLSNPFWFFITGVPQYPPEPKGGYGHPAPAYKPAPVYKPAPAPVYKPAA